MRSAPASFGPSRWAELLSSLAILFAYLGGLVVVGVALLSAVSILGRSTMNVPLLSAFSRPITGDFELVEIGTALGGTLFLPYCQATVGHIVVDFFTLKASERTKTLLDRLGAFLIAATFLVVAWRTAAGAADNYDTGETSMLLGFPIWLGYAAAVPGVVVAGIIALAQSAGMGFTSYHGRE